MVRAIRTGLLSLLLLFMQQETVRHALEHFSAQLQRAEHSALETSSGDRCVECALLAAGTASTPSVFAPFAAGPAPWLRVRASLASAAAVAPTFYRSRAPPVPFQSA